MQRLFSFPHLLHISLFSLVCFLVFLSGQFLLRSSANDPQIEIAENLARVYSLGSPIQMQPLIPIEQSLSLFAMVADNTGTVVTSTGLLHNAIPQPPKTLFTDANTERRTTWQPEKNVRIATVVVPFHTPSINGYVLTGRSLKETESRTNMLMVYAGLAWILGLAAMALVTFLQKKQ